MLNCIIYYIYKEDLLWVWTGWGLSISAAHTSEKPSDSYTPTAPALCGDKYISAWGDILMTTSHSSRCWNTLYKYKVDIDMLWVWSGWDAPIIINSMIQVRNQVNHLLASLCCEPSIYQVGVVPLFSRRWKTTYMYEEHLLWVWSVWGVLIIRNSRTPWQNQVNHLLYLWLWTVRLSIYQVELHPYDL